MADKKLIEGIKKALDTGKERKFLESVEIAINLKDVDLATRKKPNKWLLITIFLLQKHH